MRHEFHKAMIGEIVACWLVGRVAWEVTALEEELLLVQEERDAFQAQRPCVRNKKSDLLNLCRSMSHSRTTSPSEPATPIHLFLENRIKKYQETPRLILMGNQTSQAT